MDSNSRGVLLGVALGLLFVIGVVVIDFNWSAETNQDRGAADRRADHVPAEVTGRFKLNLAQSDFDRSFKVAKAERLGEKSARAGHAGRASTFRGRDENDQNFSEPPANLGQELLSVHGLHFPVRKYQPVVFLAEPIQCGFTVFRHIHVGKTKLLQVFGYDETHRLMGRHPASY